MLPLSPEETAYFEEFVSAERKARLKEVLSHRTRKLVLVLEDILDPHNASACIRSSEAMGLQELHVVAPRHAFTPTAGITQGADKWMDIKHHSGIDSCLEHLHERGFTVAAGVLDEGAVPIQELDFSRPMALVFGNEHEGISPQMVAACDQHFYVPMYGFSQSFNISVATALAVHYAVSQRVRIFGANGDLASDDMDALYSRWVFQSVKMGDAMLKRYRSGKVRRSE
jgi:tRNA (guanosine-2'-O-)-methyltransferase